MSTTTRTAPEYVMAGSNTLVPYICVHDTRAAIAWYSDVLGAELRGELIVMDDGRVGHAELVFGEIVLMMADEFPEIGVVSPRGQEGSSMSLTLHVPDVDATYALAIEQGAEAERPPADEFYGARSGWFRDPFGHRWSVQTALRSDAERPAVPEGIADVQPVGPASAAPIGQLGYFTFAAPNVDRAAAFYGALFGWAFQPAEPMSTTPDRRYRHISNTAVAMGIHEDTMNAGPQLYYRVDDLDAMVARVRELGGEVLEVTDYASGGNARCRDDQGVEFDLWKPAPGY